MPVRYDDETSGFVIESDHCQDCNQPLYDSGCDAPGCNGYACPDCGTGCDLDFAPEGEGRCAAASEDESDEEYDARVKRERAAFGLSPIGGAS